MRLECLVEDASSGDFAFAQFAGRESVPLTGKGFT